MYSRHISVFFKIKEVKCINQIRNNGIFINNNNKNAKTFQIYIF